MQVLENKPVDELQRELREIQQALLKAFDRNDSAKVDALAAKADSIKRALRAAQTVAVAHGH